MSMSIQVWAGVWQTTIATTLSKASSTLQQRDACTAWISSGNYRPVKVIGKLLHMYVSTTMLHPGKKKHAQVICLPRITVGQVYLEAADTYVIAIMHCE